MSPLKREHRSNLKTPEKSGKELKLLAHALSTVLRLSQDGLVIGDLDGYIVEVNEAILKINGSTSKEDFVGKHVTDFLVVEDRDRAASESFNVIVSGAPRISEYRAISKSGREIPVEVRTEIIVDEYGEKIGFIDVIRDLSTNRKESSR